jgi:hypothetical protein
VAQHVGVYAADARDLGQRQPRLPRDAYHLFLGLRVVDAAAVALAAHDQPPGDRFEFLCHYVPIYYVGT